MLKSIVPEQYRQKAPLFYKYSVIYKILVLSALLSLGTFCIALVYYVAIVEPSPTTNLYDCGGDSCKSLYKEKSGCEWPAFYSGSFKFTTMDEDDSSGESAAPHGDESETEHEDWFGHRRILQEDDCEPQNGNYWIIAGQHYGSHDLENVLVQVSGYELDSWSVVNLSWNAASMTWTLSSAIFSLILGLGGDRFLHPEIMQGGSDMDSIRKNTHPELKEIELAEGTNLPEENAESPVPE